MKTIDYTFGDWIQYTPDVIKNYANFSIDPKEKIMKVYSVKFGELDIDDHFIFDKMFLRKTDRVDENITEDLVNAGLVKPNCLNICNGKRYILKYDTECFLLNNPLEGRDFFSECLSNSYICSTDNHKC